MVIDDDLSSGSIALTAASRLHPRTISRHCSICVRGTCHLLNPWKTENSPCPVEKSVAGAGRVFPSGLKSKLSPTLVRSRRWIFVERRASLSNLFREHVDFSLKRTPLVESTESKLLRVEKSLVLEFYFSSRRCSVYYNLDIERNFEQLESAE